MNNLENLALQHVDITRRYFLDLVSTAAAVVAIPQWSSAENETSTELNEWIAKLEYLTKDEDFFYLGRGNPPPHALSDKKKIEVGLTRESWQLEVFSDEDNKDFQEPKVLNPLVKAIGTALDWQGLMKLAEKHAVRFLSAFACTNIGNPVAMGLWEGVPLKEILWLTKPQENVRRVFYYGYHNDDPKQRFQSSLPIGRVLEEARDELPVIVCFKLNNQWLTPKRGGPVRMLVPGQYGNKSVKWLQKIVLTNDPKANDTYAEWNNDTDSPLKTKALFLHTPKRVKQSEAFAITGVAQVGMSGLKQVQYCIHPQGSHKEEDDPYLTHADWKEAEILPPPKEWGGGLPDGILPSLPLQFDAESGQPKEWPLRYTHAHWAALVAPVAKGEYELCCRTIDENGIAQPLPRPFLKSGHNAIQRVKLVCV